jgi:phytoene synthase
LSDVYDYAVRVAGSVGAMMAVLMGVRDPASVARACDLGVAMQLTNIARDVGEDARNGRLYLPRGWLRAEGLDPERWLARPQFCRAVGLAVERLLQAAEALYVRADGGIAALPAKCRPGIFAARHLYREIGVMIARQGFDSVSGRAHVPGRRKLALLGRAVIDAPHAAAAPAAEPPLAEAAYLVAAAAASQPRPPQSARASAHPLADRILWVAELFAALERRERMPGERA